MSRNLMRTRLLVGLLPNLFSLTQTYDYLFALFAPRLLCLWIVNTHITSYGSNCFSFLLSVFVGLIFLYFFENHLAMQWWWMVKSCDLKAVIGLCCFSLESSWWLRCGLLLSGEFQFSCFYCPSIMNFVDKHWGQCLILSVGKVLGGKRNLKI